MRFLQIFVVILSVSLIFSIESFAQKKLILDDDFL